MNPEGAADRETTYSSFHRRHGDNIALGNDGRTAWRKKGEYRKALVFSEGPMPVGNVFQLKILSNHPMGDLRIGITSCDPFTIHPLPTDASQTYDSPHYWVLSGEVIHHRAYEKRMNFSIAELLVGDIIGCCVTKKGRLEYFVNGKKKGIGWGGLPIDKPLWGFVDLSGKTDYVASQFICGEPVGGQDVPQTSQTLKSVSETKARHLESETRSLPGLPVSTGIRIRTASLDPIPNTHHTGGPSVRGRSQTVTASVRVGAVQGSTKRDGSCQEELKGIKQQLQDIIGPSVMLCCGIKDGRETSEGEEEGSADISSLLSALKVRMAADREEMQAMDRENDEALNKRDKRIKKLEGDIATYQVAIAQLQQDQQSLRAKYLALGEELQGYVSTFKDSMRETQSNLEGARGELADQKKEMEMCLGEKRHKDTQMDGLTEEEKGPKLCSRPLINEQNCDYVLDTEPVVDSGKPG